ncbi:MAG TPA: rod shape-determining protein MreD [Gemmatimonadaceae bacterium]|jgi:rod shape-determining protein MreD|nr:rod shape-determining protein MreD [Gemmatimonadaceae bacterium]
MNWRRALALVVAFLILVTLHYTIRPLLGWRASIDFLVIAVLLLSVRMRPGAAAALGFITGLVSDSLTPATLGAGALAMSVVGFAASWLRAVIFADNVVLHAFFFFIGKWVFDLIYLIIARGAPPLELLAQAGVWSPLSAALTAAAGVFVMLAYRMTLDPQHA